jgi:hypothetical protein
MSKRIRFYSLILTVFAIAPAHAETGLKPNFVCEIQCGYQHFYTTPHSSGSGEVQIKKHNHCPVKASFGLYEDDGQIWGRLQFYKPSKLSEASGMYQPNIHQFDYENNRMVFSFPRNPTPQKDILLGNPGKLVFEPGESTMEISGVVLSCGYRNVGPQLTVFNPSPSQSIITVDGQKITVNEQNSISTFEFRDKKANRQKEVK